MKNLTTRKIVLGLLMTLVLGFGVPSIVNAVPDPSLTERTNAQIIADTLTTTRVGSQFDLGNLTLTGQKAGTKESITITIPSGITLSEPVHSTSSVTLTEKEIADTDDATPGNQPGNGPFFHGTTEFAANASVNVIGHFTTAGKKTITIKGTAYDSAGDATAWTYTFIYYVTQPTPDRTKAFNLQSLTEGNYNKGNFDRASIKIHNASGNFPVTFAATSGTLRAEYPSRGRENLPTDGLISSAHNVYLQMGSATSVVTARVSGSDVTTTGVYIYGFPTLRLGHPSDPNGDGETTDATTGSQAMRAKVNQTIPIAFTATVRDGASTPALVSDVVVKFQVRGGGTAGGYVVFDSSRGTEPNVGILVTSTNRQRLGTDGNNLPRDADTILHVRTVNGVATVGFEFGTNEKQDVTVSTVGLTKSVSVYTESPDAGPQFTEHSSQLRAGKYDLRATVKDDGVAQFNSQVEFSTSDGTLIMPSTGDETESNDILTVMTNQLGKVFVIFDPDETSGAPRVTADLVQPADTVADTPRRILDSITFNVRGGGTTRQPTSPPSGTQQQRLEISVFGEDGDTSRAVIVNALNSAGQAVSISIPITLSGTALATSQSATTGQVTTITPPTAADTYTLIATDPAGNYASDTERITVSEPEGEGTLNVTTVGVPVNGQQTIEVTVEDADGDAPTGEVVVTLTGPGISRTVETVNGTGRAIITLPNTATYTLTVTAEGYNPTQVAFTPGTQTTTDTTTTTTTTTTTGTPGVADSIEIDGSRSIRGTVNQNTPLRVRVTDANNRGVSNVRVTFSVLAPGRGRLSQRGNGRAIRVNTDRNGYASASLTPLGGNVIVEAGATGVSARVTFIIDVGEAVETREPATPSRDTPSSREIDPVIHVGKAQRPPMLWIDGGRIYALVGTVVQEFAPSVDNALNIAVGGGKVYWTEMTGESAGTINSAKLDGSDVKELKAIKAVPMGIAVDTAGDKLYWTNARGRIQSADLDGSGIENVIVDLPGPMDIAVARGNLYWTQYDETDGEGNVGIANATGRGTPKYISTGSDMPGSLVIGGNKVYWTEMTGSNAGTINSANLNGTNPTELNDIRAVPMGIAVDTARSKLYWTNSRGRIQSADLDGSGIRNVVDGLGMPEDMVISNSITAPAKAPTTDGEQTASTSQYDINGDGSVDSKDVDALIVAVAAGITDAKYDVNGDGKVDIFDVSAVSSKRDDGAAAAPALLGTKLSIVQIDRLQDQIDLLIASGDRSPDTMRLLIYLQQLIVMARPEKTQVLANYPNPFNPETWIPYELATDTPVKITIYNTQGVVIRTLAFGHQSAGYYTGRDRAAYWDGRNAFGEQVASGIYFYQFETDEISSMRKMVILK